MLPQQSNKSISLRCAKYKRKNEMKNNPKKKKNRKCAHETSVTIK